MEIIIVRLIKEHFRVMKELIVWIHLTVYSCDYCVLINLSDFYISVDDDDEEQLMDRVVFFALYLSPPALGPADWSSQDRDTPPD